MKERLRQFVLECISPGFTATNNKLSVLGDKVSDLHQVVGELRAAITGMRPSASSQRRPAKPEDSDPVPVEFRGQEWTKEVDWDRVV